MRCRLSFKKDSGKGVSEWKGHRRLWPSPSCLIGFLRRWQMGWERLTNWANRLGIVWRLVGRGWIPSGVEKEFTYGLWNLNSFKRGLNVKQLRHFGCAAEAVELEILQNLLLRERQARSNLFLREEVVALAITLSVYLDLERALWCFQKWFSFAFEVLLHYLNKMFMTSDIVNNLNTAF